MGDEPIVISSGQVISPETVMNRSFTSAFRGYHPAEVREFLKRVSDEMAASAEREVELRRALQDALQRAAHPELDEAAITNLLGEHAARLLASARETAAAITAEAQQQADTLLREAEQRIGRMREEAEGLMARRVAEADKAADSIRQAAEAEARAVAERAEAEAGALLESAKRQGKEMVGEGRAVRERMLADLARRKRAAQVQLEQLLAGRDRLLAAYEVVQRTVEQATAELDAAEPEARRAAEAVARRGDDPEPAPRPERRPLPPPREAPAPPPPVARRLEQVVPPSRPAPERPPLRPQTVAGAVGRVPSLPPEPPPPRPVPAPPSELATGEVPIVTADGPQPPPSAPAPPNPPPEVLAPVASLELPPLDLPPSDVDALFARIRADEEDLADEEEQPVDVGEPGVPQAADAGPAPLDPVTSERALEGRDELLDNLEAGLTRALKRVLQDEQNEVLDSLRRLRNAAGPEVLPPAGAQLAAYRDAALPWLQQAARAGIGFVSDPGTGAPAAHDHPSLDDQAEALARELVEPLRDRLARAVGSGDDAEDPSVVGERLRAVYRQWKVQHVEESARHAALTAFNVSAFAATPPVAALQWLVDDDGHCPDCDDNALAGPTAKGEPFPTGQLHPPAHPGCRCLIVAVGA